MTISFEIEGKERLDRPILFSSKIDSFGNLCFSLNGIEILCLCRTEGNLKRISLSENDIKKLSNIKFDKYGYIEVEYED